MKATLEFNLPDEWEEFDTATQGRDVVTAVRKHLYNLRMQLKHGIEDDQEARIVERCRAELLECLEERGVAHIVC